MIASDGDKLTNKQYAECIKCEKTLHGTVSCFDAKFKFCKRCRDAFEEFKRGNSSKFKGLARATSAQADMSSALLSPKKMADSKIKDYFSLSKKKNTIDVSEAAELLLVRQSPKRVNPHERMLS